MTAPEAIAITQTLDRVMRQDRGRLLAALIARLNNFQLAEDALHEATLSALSHWGRAGLPQSPQGWLLRVALHKAIDRLRGQAREARKVAGLGLFAEPEAMESEPQMIPDDRLRLIFTCCHPALDQKSRVALTLRMLGGVTTGEIARAFLDSEATMGQRLSRAKAKIAAAGIPFRLPEPEDLADRLQSVLVTVYLVFTAGYTNGPSGDRDLCEEAVFLARMLDQLAPDQPEVEGALALLLLTHARRAARQRDGASVALADQDRALWDRPLRDEGLALLDRALDKGRPGPFQIKAAIAACESQTPPDWPQIAALYAALLIHEPTDVIRLNHAVALAEAGNLTIALNYMEALEETLDGYQPFYAAWAEYLGRAGRTDKALAAYARAISLAPSPADAGFLTRRRDRLLA